MNALLAHMPAMLHGAPAFAAPVGIGQSGSGQCVSGQSTLGQPLHDMATQDFRDVLKHFEPENASQHTPPTLWRPGLPEVEQGTDVSPAEDQPDKDASCESVGDAHDMVNVSQLMFAAMPVPHRALDHPAHVNDASMLRPLGDNSNAGKPGVISVSGSPEEIETIMSYAFRLQAVDAHTHMAIIPAAIMPAERPNEMPQNMLRLAREIALLNAGIVSQKPSGTAVAVPIAMEFRLSPPNLGMIQVQMLASDHLTAHQLDLRIVTQSQNVQNMMQSHAAILASALDVQGLSLGIYAVDVAPAIPVPMAPSASSAFNGSSSGMAQDRTQNGQTGEFGQTPTGGQSAGHNAPRNEHFERHAVNSSDRPFGPKPEDATVQNSNKVDANPWHIGRYA